MPGQDLMKGGRVNSNEGDRVTIKGPFDCHGISDNCRKVKEIFGTWFEPSEAPSELTLTGLTPLSIFSLLWLV